MPLQATSGAASYDAFGGGVAAVPQYIEDVFSVQVYGTSASPKTITNGIDLSGKGGLVWTKARNIAEGHRLVDTVRGATKVLLSNETGAQATESLGLTSFLSDGYVVNVDAGYNGAVGNSYTYASWTFRKQPKFFDIVTYTGNGVSNREIAHNLGSTPGCIMVKRTDASGNWHVYHISLPADSGAPLLDTSLLLNSTAQALDYRTFANSTFQTDTIFKLGNANIPDINANGATYVAYLFAHNAGGFGLTGTDNVISCGSWTTNSDVNLGYEPQWILYRNAGAIDNWKIVDNMRGLSNTDGTFTAQAVLNPNTSSAEGTASGVFPTATGFTTGLGSATYIYIAIRRGPMKTPTTGTSVFAPNDGTGSTSGQTISTSFPVDLAMSAYKTQGFVGLSNDRLRGISNTNTAGTTPALQTSTTQAESAFSGTNPWFINAWNNRITRGSNGADPSGGIVTWLFGRAPGFFDVVCYTGNSTNPTSYNHNLTVVPELLIIKRRTGLSSWPVFYNFVGSTFDKLQGLNDSGVASTGLSYSAGAGLGGAPTTTTFTLDSTSTINGSGHNFVAYLFATCPGVQSIQSYVGDGTTGRTINCGFTGGARFVCIKVTSTTGSWWTFDSARGIVTNNDPALQLNSTAAEVTSADAIDTAASGFIVNQEATCSLNASGVSYLVWAIA